MTIWNLRHTVLACLLVALTAASAWAVETVWLDELDVSLSKCGWNKTLANKAVGGAPLSQARRSGLSLRSDWMMRAAITERPNLSWLLTIRRCGKAA